MPSISAQTRADLLLTALRMMRGAHKRRQDRGPNAAWNATVERWLAYTEQAEG